MFWDKFATTWSKPKENLVDKDIFIPQFTQQPSTDNLSLKIERLERLVDALIVDRAYKIVAKESVADLHNAAIITLNEHTQRSYNNIGRQKREQEAFNRLLVLRTEVRDIEQDFPNLKDL